MDLEKRNLSATRIYQHLNRASAHAETGMTVYQETIF
jgi:hypothetical protein